MTLPIAPIIFRRPRHETYVQWLQTAPEHKLERADRVHRQDDRTWREKNPVRARQLDVLVGKLVRLSRACRTYGDTLYVKGSPFAVFYAFCGKLHAVAPVPYAEPVVVLLNPDDVQLDEVTPFELVDAVRRPGRMQVEL